MAEEEALNPPAAQSAPKVKTKAKKRYLKAKKERRKKRKVQSESTVHAEEQYADESDDDVDVNVEDGEDSVSPESGPQPTAATNDSEKRGERKEKRPKKRQKVEHAEDGVYTTTVGIEEGTVKREREDNQTLDISQTRRSPTPQVSLPLFPLPKRPEGPSKSALAMQGLDRALIEAELVDPQNLVSLAREGDKGSKYGISARMIQRLHDLGIEDLFAVQTAVVPFLLSDRKQRGLYLPYDFLRDVCVSAPTGSGKTLAYVVPIVEILCTRVVTRLRALVVLPTRDLVAQVRETFEAVGKGRGLKIGTATGQHSFAHEQSQLVADDSHSLQGGSSKVDILICTPGRLIDHLIGTPNFSLQHLRFLVIDEADRLLTQSFQDWLAQVLAATRVISILDISATIADHRVPQAIPYSDSLSPAFLDHSRIYTDLDDKKQTSCQKLLFSATLTRDPSKIAALNLRDPKYFIVQSKPEGGSSKEDSILDLAVEKFSMPATLTERMIVCETAQKPLMLFHLVLKHDVKNALVFTKSAESTTRLVRLFEFFEGMRTSTSGASDQTRISVRAYSSELPPSERKVILEQFKNQNIHILVCSDLISRGIDISHVLNVVNYDAPVDMRKYVHRAGRTARAGRAGDAWTLVEEQEARYFKDMLKNADHLAAVKRMRVSDKDVAPLIPYYEASLGRLKDLYGRSRNS